MKFKKISLLSLLLVCTLLVTACDGGDNVGGTNNPDTPTVEEPPAGSDPDDTKTDETEPGIVEPDDNPNDDGDGDGDGGDNNPDDPDNPDNPDNPDDPDTGSGGDGGDTGGTSDPDNPDDPDDPDDEDEYTIYQAYSHAFTKDVDVGSVTTGTGTTTQNGLTWTYIVPDGVTLSKASNDTKGIQIGTGSAHPTEENPFVISTTFGETVRLKSVDVYTFTSSGSSYDGYCTVTLDGNEVTSSTYKNAHSDPYQTTKTDMTLEGKNLSISIYSTNSAAYLKAISLSIYTTESTSLSLSVEDDYRPADCPDDYTPPTITKEPGTVVPDPDNPEEYTKYQTWSHPFVYSDLNGKNSTTINGLGWNFDTAEYLGNGSVRGVQIGTTSQAQTEYWTISTSFNSEVVQLMDVTVYLFTATTGTGSYDISFNGHDLASGNFSATSTDITSVYQAEVAEAELFGGELTISLKANGQYAIYLYGISLSVYTTEDSILNLEEEDIFPADYEPAPVVPGENDVLPTVYTWDYDNEDTALASYYSDIDLDKTGEDLREELNKHQPQTKYTYDNVRYMFPYTDEDPENEGYMYGIYDGDKLPAYWNGNKYDREHVWACSHMRLIVKDDGDFRPSGSSVGHYSDIHNLRVCCKPVNTSKNDKYFGDVTDTNNFFANVTDPESIGSGKHYFDGNREGDHRGDGARCCLYMYVTYLDLNLEDGLINGDDQAYTSYGQLTTLVKWALEDQPDEFEIQRNNRIYEYQGNRNPFIDYPELVEQLFPDIVASL